MIHTNRYRRKTVEEKVSDLTLENLSAQVGNILDRSIKIEKQIYEGLYTRWCTCRQNRKIHLL